MRFLQLSTGVNNAKCSVVPSHVVAVSEFGSVTKVNMTGGAEIVCNESYNTVLNQLADLLREQRVYG